MKPVLRLFPTAGGAERWRFSEWFVLTILLLVILTINSIGPHPAFAATWVAFDRADGASGLSQLQNLLKVASPLQKERSTPDSVDRVAITLISEGLPILEEIDQVFHTQLAEAVTAGLAAYQANALSPQNTVPYLVAPLRVAFALELQRLVDAVLTPNLGPARQPSQALQQATVAFAEIRELLLEADPTAVVQIETGLKELQRAVGGDQAALIVGGAQVKTGLARGFFHLFERSLRRAVDHFELAQASQVEAAVYLQVLQPLLITGSPELVLWIEAQLAGHPQRLRPAELVRAVRQLLLNRSESALEQILTAWDRPGRAQRVRESLLAFQLLSSEYQWYRGFDAYQQALDLYQALHEASVQADRVRAGVLVRRLQSEVLQPFRQALL